MPRIKNTHAEIEYNLVRESDCEMEKENVSNADPRRRRYRRNKCENLKDSVRGNVR